MSDVKVVRALDVGHGNVKFAIGHADQTRPVQCDSFASRAPAASDGDLGAGMLHKRNTVVVSVNGTRYEVGHDVVLAQSTNDETTVLDKDFALSDSYMARVLGALHYMVAAMPEGADRIDMLVVGLPVNTIEMHKEALAAKMRGTHKLPFDREVFVEDVHVFPQPLGAFFNFMYSKDDQNQLRPEELKSQMNLVIDPGFFTFDWLLAKGMKAITPRSGAVNRAMSDIIMAMAKEVAKKHGTQANLAFKIIDDALREGKKPRVFGQTIELADFMSSAKNVINEAVASLSKSVGDGADIDNIILVGGGAEFFMPAIQAKFPKHTIITTKQSVFANVTGFQLAGERAMLTKQVQERKAALQS